MILLLTFKLKKKWGPEVVKLIYSEKATKFCDMSIVDLSNVLTVKSTVEISQNFVAFSEYLNFILQSAVSTETFT